MGRAILAIETSQSQGSVALGEGSEEPLEEVFPPGLVHSRELFPRIEALFHRAGVQLEELSLVAADGGPGSYTGIRIGIAAAKAIAYARRIPALAVSSLEVIARNVRQDGDFAVLLDARRGAFYGARFRKGRGRIERLSPDRVAPLARLLTELPTGTALLANGEVPGARGFPRLRAEWAMPRAAEVYRLAAETRAAIEGGTTPPPPEWGDPHVMNPFYLRPSEAEERLATRHKGEC